MQIGNYEVYALETGRFKLDGGAMFGVVPKNLWYRYNPADDQNRIELALRAMLLKSNNRIIIVDNGIGHKLNEKLQKMYAVDFSKYSLEKSLADVGINRKEVTDVILTHLHFDHSGGTTLIENGELKLTFPNATHHIQAEQWNWANSPSEKDRASFFPDNFSLIEKMGKLNLQNGPGEFLPEIEALVMYGHTQGMQLIKVSENEKTIIYCADLIPTASHIPVPWVMAYDNNPLVTLEEKKRLLPQVIKNNWILFFEHDPFRAAGTVQQTEKGFSLKEEIKLL